MTLAGVNQDFNNSVTSPSSVVGFLLIRKDIPKITAKEGDPPPPIWRSPIFGHPCAEMKGIGLRIGQNRAPPYGGGGSPFFYSVTTMNLMTLLPLQHRPRKPASAYSGTPLPRPGTVGVLSVSVGSTGHAHHPHATTRSTQQGREISICSFPTIQRPLIALRNLEYP